MATSSIDLSAGLVPNQPAASDTGGVDLSAGLVPNDSASPDIADGLVAHNPPAPVNPHAIQGNTAPLTPAPPPSGAVVSASGPQSMFQRARSYVANSPVGRSLSSSAPELADTLGLTPTESDTARQQDEKSAGQWLEYHPVDSAKQIGQGAENVAGAAGIGPKAAAQGTRLDQAAQGANQMMSGAMGVAKPLIAAGIAADPIAAAIQYGAGILAGEGAAQVAQRMGATPQEQDFFHTLGFFFPGVLASTAGVKAATGKSSYEATDPVTGEAQSIPVQGAAVRGKGFAGVVGKDETGAVYAGGRVGPYSGSVRVGRPAGAAPVTSPSALPQGEVLPPSGAAIQSMAQAKTVAETAARAAAINQDALRVAGLAPAAPPPPAPGEPGSKQMPMPPGMANGHLPQQTVNMTVRGIKSLPEPEQVPATLETVGNLAKWLSDQKTVVGPTGKVLNVDSPKMAQTEAVHLINDEVERHTQAAQDQADADAKAKEDALAQQAKDRETAEQERLKIQQDAAQGKAPELAPDVPRNNAVRQALMGTPPGTPRSQLMEVARRAAVAGKFVLPKDRANQLVDEHLGRVDQMQTAQESNAPSVPPGQSPAELKPWVEDVKAGNEPFAHVAEGSAFKPKDIRGLRKTVVENAQAANGTYYHSPKIAPEDLQQAAQAGTLGKIQSDWRAAQNEPAAAPTQSEAQPEAAAAPVTATPEAAETFPGSARQDAGGVEAAGHPDTAESKPVIHEETGLPLNSDGTVTLYHGTTKPLAELIRKTGKLKSSGEPDVYLSTAKGGTGYGDGTVVPVRVDPSKLQLDDEFPDGRKDFRIDTGKPGGSVSVKIDKDRDPTGNPHAQEKGTQPEPKQSTELNPRTLQPKDVVEFTRPDGSTGSGVLRFKNPAGKWVVKGERKAFPASDLKLAEPLPGMAQEIESNHASAGEEEAKRLTAELHTPGGSIDKAAGEMERNSPLFANSEANPQPSMFPASSGGTTLYSTPFDPALVRKYIGEPLGNVAEPVREFLARHYEVADVANHVHDILQNLDRTNRATGLHAKELLHAMAKEGFTQEDGAAVYRHIEDPSLELTPRQEVLRDQWIEPMLQAARVAHIQTQLLKSGKFTLEQVLKGEVPEQEIAKIVPLEEHYQRRIPVEKDTLADKLLQDSAKRFRAGGGKLSRVYAAAKRTIFREIHGPTGEREAVAVKDGRVIQFVTQENADILAERLGKLQGELAKEKESVEPDEEKAAHLEKQIDDLRARQEEVAQGGRATVDLGSHRDGYVSTAEIANEAVAPLERELESMQTEFRILHGSQGRALASQQRIENLYYRIAETEKRIAAIRASIGPEEAAKEGMTRDEGIQQEMDSFRGMIASRQAEIEKLEATENRTQRQNRLLRGYRADVQDYQHRVAELADQADVEGLHGKYWRDKDGRIWKFDRGTTDFLSERTGQEYHADARLSGLINFLETDKARNAAVVLEQTKNILTERGLMLKMKEGSSSSLPDGWKPTELPQMRGYAFPAHIADALDQFHYLQSRGAPNVLEQANSLLLQFTLMNPIMHGGNIVGNFLAGKGAEFLAGKGISPQWYADQVKGGVRAVNMMKNPGGEEYQQLLRTGLDLRGSDASLDDHSRDILASFTKALIEQPEQNKLVSAVLGVKNAGAFLQKMNHEITFGMGDLALAQSYYAKHLELTRKGVPNADEAARDWAHEAVGEYTTPVRFAGSASLGRLYENPLLQAFSRYHFGYLLRPILNSVKDALPHSAQEFTGGGFKPDEEASRAAGETVNKFGQTPAEQRAVAIGRLLFLAITAIYLYPKLLNPLAKKVTGDDRAEWPGGGLPGMASRMYETGTDEKSIAAGLGSAGDLLFAPGPALMDGVELAKNYDFFKGQHIRDPYASASTQAKQVGTWLAKGTYPGQMSGRVDQGGARKALEAMLGFKFPLKGGLKAAMEIRHDEAGKMPSNPETSRVFQSILAAAEQAHKTGERTLADALVASGKLTYAQRRTLKDALREPPIVFAVRGMEHPADYYHVYERSTPEEQKQLMKNPHVRHMLDRYQKSLPQAKAAPGRTLAESKSA